MRSKTDTKARGGNAVDEMHALFDHAGLGIPWVPSALATKLRRAGEWCYSTLGKTPTPYNFSDYLELVTEPTAKDFLVVGHAGYGANSYAISYYLKLGRIRLLLQLAWGGFYMDKQETTENVKLMFEAIASCSAEIESAAAMKNPPWVFAYSELYGGRSDGRKVQGWEGLKATDLAVAIKTCSRETSNLAALVEERRRPVQAEAGDRKVQIMNSVEERPIPKAETAGGVMSFDLNTSLELSHIGEALVARLLDGLADMGQLDALKCEISSVRLVDDLGSSARKDVSFWPECAKLQLVSEQGVLHCDGEQRIDVLAEGPAGSVALELKLGKTLLTYSAFGERFLKECSPSEHKPPRLKGSMPSVLERKFPSGMTGSLQAVHDGFPPRPLAGHWWLVLREKVWNSWKCSPQRPPPTQNARILLLEKIVRAHGTADAFDEVVKKVVGTGFAKRWGLAEK